MLVNEKVWKRKTPEATALEITTDRYILYVDDNQEDTMIRCIKQGTLDMELANTAMRLIAEERWRWYIR